ncbi:TolC family protein [Chitinophagaceae bacterium LB-8]|uniref:TolC family protein n=1 Tax=Paraflavisolibacter caeni TaxID=2982496 RepID=A0A9X3BHV8_9BACT|nr:TolC family protein [Paraflavisolibacter caeni]MCU7550267.1 TolC family protein [Paraflavisolibacter caeni]
MNSKIKNCIQLNPWITIPNLFVSIVTFLVLSTSAKAQQQTLSIEDAIAISLANNYDILLSRNDSSLAALDYSYSVYAFAPRLNATGGMIYNIVDNKRVLANGTKRDGNNIKSSNLTASVSLNWTLFDGLKMFATRKKLGEFMELGELQIKNQVVTSVAEVMRTYYDIVRQQQQLKAIEEQMDLINERLKLAQYKLDIGTGAKPDMLQAQIDLNAQRSAHMTQQTNILKLKEQLNQLLAVSVNTNYSVIDSIPINATLSLDAIQSGVTSVNPQLLITQKNLDIAQLTLKEKKADRFPVISFNSAYNFNRNDNKSVVDPYQPLFNQNRGFNYGLAATIPLFNGMNTRRLIKSAELDIKYQELLYKRDLAQITSSIANAYKDYDLHKRTLQLEEDNIKLVRENLFIARERYRLGVSTFLEMREAQRSLEDANNRLIGARYNTKVAEIELMRLRGDLVQ